MMRLSVLLAAACVLLPIWIWSPHAIGDARSDGGWFAFAVLALGVARWREREQWRWPAGTSLFLAAMALGGLAWWFHSGLPILGGLADRAVWFSAWALICLAPGSGFPASHPGFGASRVGPTASRVAAVVFGGTVLASLYGLLQWIGIDPFGWKPEPHSPPTAPYANSNVAAEVIAPLLVLAALRLPRPRERQPSLTLAWAVGMPVLAVHLGALQVLAAAVSLPLGLALACLRDPRRLPWYGIVLLLFGVGWLARDFTTESSPGSTANSTETASGLRPSGEVDSEDAATTNPRQPAFASVKVRRLIWQAGLEQAFATPLGIGLGRFEVDYPAWRPSEELRLSSADFTDPATPRPKTPHSEPVLALVELGWLGLVLLALAIMQLIGRNRLASWVIPGLVCLGVHALVRSPLSDNPASLALCALMLAQRDTSARPGSAPRFERRWAPILALSLAILGALAAPSQITGEKSLAERFRTTSPGERLRALETSVRWRPWHAVSWVLLAAERGLIAETPEAMVQATPSIRTALDRAIEADPYNLRALTARLRLEMLAHDGHWNVGLAALEQAELIAPEHPSVVDGRRRIETNINWLFEEARRKRKLGASLMSAGQRGYRNHLLAAKLLEALGHARRDKLEEAREELAAAARAHPTEQAGLIERTSRRDDLDHGTVYALVLRVLNEILPPGGGEPAWRSMVGPPP